MRAFWSHSLSEEACREEDVSAAEESSGYWGMSGLSVEFYSVCYEIQALGSFLQ